MRFAPRSVSGTGAVDSLNLGGIVSFVDAADANWIDEAQKERFVSALSDVFVPEVSATAVVLEWESAHRSSRV